MLCEAVLGRRAHAVPGSEETGWKRAGIVWTQAVYVEQPGGITCSPDGIMSSILIVVAWARLVS